MRTVTTIRPKSAPAAIDPDVKEFVDAVLVPLLVRAALDDLAEEKLAQSRSTVAICESDK